MAKKCATVGGPGLLGRSASWRAWCGFSENTAASAWLSCRARSSAGAKAVPCFWNRPLPMLPNGRTTPPAGPRKDCQPGVFPAHVHHACIHRGGSSGAIGGALARGMGAPHGAGLKHSGGMPPPTPCPFHPLPVSCGCCKKIVTNVTTFSNNRNLVSHSLEVKSRWVSLG